MAGLAEREEKRKKSVIGAMIDSKSNQTDTIEEPIAKKEEAEQGIIIKPKKKEETRSKRVNLLIKPSVYKIAQEKCEELGISINECVNQFLENWVKEK